MAEFFAILLMPPMGIAFASTLAPDKSFTTVELKINFFRPVWQAQLKADPLCLGWTTGTNCHPAKPTGGTGTQEAGRFLIANSLAER